MSRQLNQQSLYIVEKILAKKKKPNCPNEFLYKVKWKDWDLPKDLTWQPVQNLETVRDMLEEFNKNYATHRPEKKIDQKDSSSSSSSSQSSKQEGQKSSSSSQSQRQNSKKKQSKKIPRKVRDDSSKSKTKKLRKANQVKKMEESSEEQEKRIRIVRVNYFIRKQKEVLFDCDIQINGVRDVSCLLNFKDLSGAQNQIALAHFLQENLIENQLTKQQIEKAKKQSRWSK